MLGYEACYRHQDNTLNFKTANPSPRIVAHEYGHFLFHAYNGLGHSSEAEAEACERYAKEVEYWYVRKMNPINLSDVLTLAAIGFGTSLVASFAAALIYDYVVHGK
jgi:hypothetical protein